MAAAITISEINAVILCPLIPLTMYSALEAVRVALVGAVADTASEPVANVRWVPLLDFVDPAPRSSGGTVRSISASTSSLSFKLRRSISKSSAV